MWVDVLPKSDKSVWQRTSDSTFLGNISYFKDLIRRQEYIKIYSSVVLFKLQRIQKNMIYKFVFVTNWIKYLLSILKSNLGCLIINVSTHTWGRWDIKIITLRLLAKDETGFCTFSPVLSQLEKSIVIWNFLSLLQLCSYDGSSSTINK